MTVLQVSILASTIVLCVFSFILFYLQHKKEKQLHHKAMHHLKDTVQLHKKQINIRKEYLNTYDFLKQNLQESLHPQLEIVLNS